MNAGKTYLFIDLDGTVMVNPFGKQVFPRIFGMLSQACGIAPETLLREAVKENERRQHHSAPPSAAWIMDWDHIIQEIAGRYGVTEGIIPSDMCVQLARQYAAPPHTSTLDEAVTHLCRLEAPHRTLSVSTMGLSKYQRPVLDALGLSPCFDHILTPDLTGFQKTERGFFQDLVDAAPPDSIFISVGDNFMHDVYYPKQFGFYSVLRLPEPTLNPLDPFDRPVHIAAYRERIQYYPDDTKGVLPDAVITHLSQLPEVVFRIEEQRDRSA